MRNVVFICTDQLRYDALACLGNPVAKTPNIDTIGKKGLRFRRHITPCQICSPSRASMFTGLYPRHHKLHRNGVALGESFLTLPEALRSNGYRTHGVGKFHLQPIKAPVEHNMPESDAFWQAGRGENWRGPYYGLETVDLVIGEADVCTEGGHYAEWLKHNHPEAVNLYLPENALAPSPDDLEEVWKAAIPAELHYNNWIADRSVDFIDETDGEQPFFLYVSFPDPHHPFTPPAPYCDRFDPDEMPLPDVVPGELQSMPPYYRENRHPQEQGFMKFTDNISEQTLKLAQAHTYGMIEMIDDAVGRIIQELKDKDLYEDTLIIFTSDHGELLGDHGLIRKGPPPYRQILQTPLLISGPGIPSNRDIHSLTSHLDLFGTITSYLGLEKPDTDGQDLMPLIEGDRQAVREALFAEYHTRAEDNLYNQSIITDSWRLTLYPLEQDWGELFNLSADPNEHCNLYYEPKYGDVIERLKRMLEQNFPPRPEIDSTPLAIY